MIFSEQMRQAILAGRKTQTRRIYSDKERRKVVRGATRITRPFVPRCGRLYSVQPGRGKPTLFRILCTDIRVAKVGDITHADVRAEGFHRRSAFADYWMRLHDSSWPRLERVPCPTCMLDADYPGDELEPQHPCPECGGEQQIPFELAATEREILARFNARHAHTRVWVITFECDPTAAPTFIAERTDRAQADYVTGEAKAMSEDATPVPTKPANEPIEAVDPAYVDQLGQRAAIDHQARYDERRDQERRTRRRHERILIALQAAQRNGINVSSHTRRIERLERAGSTGDAMDRAIDALAAAAAPRPADPISDDEWAALGQEVAA